jgi:hypothetical protein
MKARMDKNLAAIAPEELMKGWMTLGGQATEQFLRMMSGAAARPKGGASEGG